jgi:hypothetical protein
MISLLRPPANVQDLGAEARYRIWFEIEAHATE